MSDEATRARGRCRAAVVTLPHADKQAIAPPSTAAAPVPLTQLREPPHRLGRDGEREDTTISSSLPCVHSRQSKHMCCACGLVFRRRPPPCVAAGVREGGGCHRVAAAARTSLAKWL